MSDTKSVTTKYFLGVESEKIQLYASNSHFYVTISTEPQSYLKTLIDQGFIDNSYYVLPGMELAFFKKLEKEINLNSVALDKSSRENLNLMYGKFKKYIKLEEVEKLEMPCRCCR